MDGEPKTKTTIVWFRRDLRVEDNPALAAAARGGGSVLPVFIWCPKEEGQFHPGRVSRWWMKNSLIHLGQCLRSLGAELVLIKAQSTLSALLKCISDVGATKLVYNHLYDPVSLVRDHNIKQKLGELGISIQSYNGELLYEPWEVYNNNRQPFTTFNAFWDKCLLMQGESAPHLPPRRLVPCAGSVDGCSIEELGLEDESEKSSNALLGRGWSPGWSNADKALNEFLEHHLLDYAKERQKVSGNSTSLLSPHLHFGELSIRKVFHLVCMKHILWAKERNSAGEESAKLFLKAIGLREYSRYICFNFPFTHERSLMSNLKYFPWNADQSHFKAWRQGRTGYPLVDAGMRELWATGWIHNRIRVIVSCFFVKFLLLPWQWGMKYFWDTLLDADLECDILGWQYISGSLPDGHELERLDNPEVQGFKFDPDGEYVRHWLPELARMPAEWIHHPWDAPLAMLKASGVELGLNYPKPIIDFDQARDRLTEAIFLMRGKEAAERATTADATDEVVFDNSEANDTVVVVGGGGGGDRDPEPVSREEVRIPCSSSHDQRVPSMHNFSNGALNRKRPLPPVEEKPIQDQLRNCYNNGEPSRVDEDLSSTAESSFTKKQITSSRASFGVPEASSLLSNGQSCQEYESAAGIKLQLQDCDIAETSHNS